MIIGNNIPVGIIEEEMVSSQLLLSLWGHSSERIVLSTQFTLQALQSFNWNLLHVDTVLEKKKKKIQFPFLLMY